MINSLPPDSAGKNAQRYFRKAGQSDTAAKQLRKSERSAEAAKTARLRDLRLAKEKFDQEEADRATAEQTAANVGVAGPAKAKRVAKTKPPAMKRMIY